ncbi:unnamed protein product [Parascedosporium putredinis]|uniref:Phosphoglycerate mutase family protein n=1 Tax=Parascedosporium putredinis TaxID=1442378 RepID=A0A9P1H2N6_9PEZI|nr:unnamed protein product [Parascedosporium putredinis]CAI7995144.1 unnamed protein product [Parascedosporium putredinis]
MGKPRLHICRKTWKSTRRSRTVGGKIASILTQAEADYESTRQAASEEDGSTQSSKQKPRRRLFRVSVHSSPSSDASRQRVASVHNVARPLVRRGTASPVLSPIAVDTNVNPLDANPRFDHRLFPRSVLRLDAFLGEWLSPAYFETITPPPSTSVMLSSAKADLLKREDYSKYSDPGLRPKPVTTKSKNQLLASALSDAAQPHAQPPPVGYIAPVPHYAITNNCKIPDGYVAHARDACSTVDYPWDSTGPPLAFGDGGMYGEEWTAMHKRFRKGLQELVDWYASCDNPGELKWSFSSDAAPQQKQGFGREDDVEEESVVILVSHGAGCNALIGAITHQPALMDVGVASITMAVRKPDGYQPAEAEWRDAPRSPATTPRTTPPVHEAYDLKMTASSEHLRGPVTPLP